MKERCMENPGSTLLIAIVGICAVESIISSICRAILK